MCVVLQLPCLFWFLILSGVIITSTGQKVVLNLCFVFPHHLGFIIFFFMRLPLEGESLGLDRLSGVGIYMMS